MKKNVKERIARFFWKNGNNNWGFYCPLGIAVSIIVGIAMAGVPEHIWLNFSGGIILFLGLLLAVSFWAISGWTHDLPDYKIHKVEKMLKNYPQSAFRTGAGLIEKAKLTGETELLEKWMEVFEEYEEAVDELRELKSQAADIPSRIRQLKRRTTDLHQSLESLAI